MTNITMAKIFAFIFLFFTAIYYLSPIITPFFLGALIAYLGNPLVTYLHSKRLPRALGASLVFLCVIFFLAILVLLLLPMIQEQVFVLIDNLPIFLSWWQDTVIAWLNAHAHIHAYFSSEAIKKQLTENSHKIGNIAAILIKAATHSTFALIDLFINIILVPVVAFYLMRDWPKILANIHDILPKSLRQIILSIAKESDEVIAAFFRGQLLVMLALALVYSMGLWLVGLKVGIFIGLLCGLLAIVPYLGFTLGILIASIAMYLETNSMLCVSYVGGVYILGQLLESMVLTPLLVGDKIGLHPVAVIFSVLSGGMLFGFLGVLLALPVAAITLVIFKYIFLNKVSHAAST